MIGAFKATRYPVITLDKAPFTHQGVHLLLVGLVFSIKGFGAVVKIETI